MLTIVAAIDVVGRSALNKCVSQFTAALRVHVDMVFELHKRLEMHGHPSGDILLRFSSRRVEGYE